MRLAPNMVLNAQEAATDGISPVALRRAVEQGLLQRRERGVYAPPDLIDPAIDLAVASARVPRAIVCLLTALRLHELTTQNPTEIWLAVPRNTWHPRGLTVPIHLVQMHAKTIEMGVETRVIAGRDVRLHDLERCIVDAFKFRSAVGLDVAIAALKECWQQRRIDIDKMMRYAKELRMNHVMRPYLDSIA